MTGRDGGRDPAHHVGPERPGAPDPARHPPPAGPRSASLGRVARGGAVNMAGAVAGAALNVGLVVAVARSFSQDVAGVLFSATSVFLIAAAVANLGTSNALVYFVARLRALGAAGQVPRVVRPALGPAVVVSAGAGGALFLFAGDVARLTGDSGAGTYVRLLALFLPLAVLTDATLAVTRAHHDMRPTVLVDKVARPLAQLALVGAVALTGAAGLLTVAWAGPYLPAAVVGWWWMRRVLRSAAPSEDRPDAPAAEGASGPTPDAPRDTGPSAPTPGEFWRFALPRSVATVAQIGIQRSGIVLVAALRGAADAAVFTAATRFMVAGQFATQAIQYAAQPRLAELLAVDDRPGANALYQTSTAWLICLTWPLFLPAIVYAPLVMRLFGPDYVSGAGVLVVIALAQLMSGALGMGDLVLTMAGRTSWNLVNNVLALAAHVVLCLVLVPPLGATGAAVAWATAIAVRKGLPLLQLGRVLGLRPFSRRWLRAAVTCLLWFGAVPLGCAAVLGGGVVSFGVALALGCAGYAATLWRSRTALALDHLHPRTHERPTPA